MTKDLRREKSLAKLDGEPKEDLSHRDKADPKAKSTESSKARDEVQPSHLRRSLKLWKRCSMVIINSSHHRRSALRKRYSQWQYPSCRRRNAVPPEKNVKMIFYNLAHLGQRLYDLSFIHGVRVLRSQWAHYLVDIVRGLVSIGLENAWSPHCQRWWGQVTEWTQVQIPRIAWAVDL